jgi:hypothetical protein
MNSRLTAAENMRAIKLAYIPAGEMLAVPDNEGGGEWRKFDPKPESQTLPRIAESPQTMLGAYKKIAIDRPPVAYVPTFSQVPDVDPGFMNQRVVTKRKSYLPVVAFDNFKSELYPQAPPLWKTSVGDPARQFER